VDLTPVPDNDTVFVSAALPAVTLRFAVFDPVLVGLNVTVIVQLAPCGTDEPQLFVCANWLAFVPEIAIDVIGSAEFAALRSVTVRPRTKFSAWLPNAITVVDKL
jgi:hypothetical protein